MAERRNPSRPGALRFDYGQALSLAAIASSFTSNARISARSSAEGIGNVPLVCSPIGHGGAKSRSLFRACRVVKFPNHATSWPALCVV